MVLKHFWIGTMKDDIKIMDNVFSDEECQQLVNQLSSVSRTESFNYGGINEYGPINNSELISRLQWALETYIERYPTVSIDRYEINCLKVIEYIENSALPLHTDNERSPTGHTRTIGAIVFLNDDFDGGELVFPRQSIFIKPKRGTLVLFPMSYMFPHMVNGVVGGKRFVARASIFNR